MEFSGPPWHHSINVFHELSFRGGAMGYPWECHRMTMAVQMTMPWRCYDVAMAVPWKPMKVCKRPSRPMNVRGSHGSADTAMWLPRELGGEYYFWGRCTVCVLITRKACASPRLGQIDVKIRFVVGLRTGCWCTGGAKTYFLANELIFWNVVFLNCSCVFHQSCVLPLYHKPVFKCSSTLVNTTTPWQYGLCYRSEVP